VHFGCTPSKALIRCARAVHEANRGAEFGFRLTTPPQVDFAKVMERVRRIRSISSEGDSVQLATGAGIDVYLGQTRFTKLNVVAVDGRELRFSKAVIATGSRPVAPTIERLQEDEYLTNETLFSLTELPQRLVILGGGPMGSELAQAFRRLGSQVDLVNSRNNLLPKDEPEAGEVLRRQFEREGVRLHFEFRAVRAVKGRLTVQSQSKTRELEYDKLLLSVGRKANLEDLGLEAAEIREGTGTWRSMRAYGRATRPSTPPATLRSRKSTHTQRLRRRSCALLTLWTERTARHAIWSSRTAPTPTPR
jgi:pyruvate/2-oxoglutarate dehydrogenase complex dihydrolipoamide dehydrogenase (E3) component